MEDITDLSGKKCKNCLPFGHMQWIHQLNDILGFLLYSLYLVCYYSCTTFDTYSQASCGFCEFSSAMVSIFFIFFYFLKSIYQKDNKISLTLACKLTELSVCLFYIPYHFLTLNFEIKPKF